MIRRLIRSVLQSAMVTAANDAPALVLDRVLMNAMEIRAFEEVDVINNATGERYTTWVEQGEPGEVRVPHMRAGDRVAVISTGLLHDGQTLAHKARVVTVGENNEVISIAENG